MKWLTLVITMVLVAGISHAELIGMKLLFNGKGPGGTVLYSVKSTNVSGTYFWYTGGTRCVVKVKGGSLDVDCPSQHRVMSIDSGDISITNDDGDVLYAQDGSLGKGMFLATMEDYNKRKRAYSRDRR